MQIVSCEQSVNENQPPSCQMSTYVLHSVSYGLSVCENQALSS